MSANSRHAAPLAFTAAGQNSTPESAAAANTTATTSAAVPATDLVEPDQEAIQPINTGRLVWTSARNGKPTVPYEVLPFPKSDRARCKRSRA